jgi:hypothetical protein
MTWTVQQAQARLAAALDQNEARIRDLERLLELLRPLAGARGPAWWVLRRLSPDQRAEVRALLKQVRAGRA